MSFLSNSQKSLARKLAKKRICATGEKEYIGKCGSRKDNKPDFRQDGVQVPNGHDSKRVPAASTLRPVLPGIGNHRMAYRSIDDSFWLSPKVRQLSPEAKLLYIYLISTASNAGIVRTIPEIIAATVGLETERIGGVLEELRGLNRIFWQAEQNLIWVVGQIDHQTIAKGGLDFYKAKGLENELHNLPEGLIRQEFKRKYSNTLKNALSTLPRRPVDAPSTPPPIKERKGKEIKTKETKTFLSENQNFSDDVVFLTSFLISKIKFNDPKAKTPELVENGSPPSVAFAKWATEIDRLIRIDKREVKEIEKVIIWCQDDSFWKSNILSAPTLRKQFPQLIMKMKNVDWIKPVEDRSIDARFNRAFGGNDD